MNLSLTILPKVKIYKLSHPIHSCNIMCQIMIKCPEPEITVYKYIAEDDTLFTEQSIISDPREYTVFNLHEDIPGIDHVGIVHYISGLFLKANIPLLYINTYGYNLILIADEYVEHAKQILKVDL